MKVRFLFRTYEISDVNKQQLLYGVAVLISILSVFGFIFMVSFYSDAPANSPFPSPTNSAFTNNLQAAANPPGQVAGAQTQQQQPPPEPEKGPQLPTPKPSPSSKPSPSPSPSIPPLQSTAASPSPSPSPSPSHSPENNNSNPTPTPTPSIPNKPDASAVCDGDKKPNIIVTWSGVIYATSYKVFRDGSEVASELTGTSYKDTNVTSGSEYKYKIKAKNTSGESGESEPASSTALTCS